MLDVELIRATLSQYATEIKSVGITSTNDNKLQLTLVWVNANGNENQWSYVFPERSLNRIDAGEVVALITSDLNITGEE